jgi:NadR type nicotinamide-nucleotide adenylyltransferase
MLKRISITGPECTGKSWLAKKLAARYNTNWVSEYAVEYLSRKGATYHIDDIEKIARGQLDAEQKVAEESAGLLFCDTDLLVNKIWSQVVFGEVSAWIEKTLSQHQYDLYLLCYPDIPWRAGPFRENPSDRLWLFGLYEQELRERKFPFGIIQGEGDQRLQNAVKFVDKLL